MMLIELFNPMVDENYYNADRVEVNNRLLIKLIGGMKLKGQENIKTAQNKD